MDEIKAVLKTCTAVLTIEYRCADGLEQQDIAITWTEVIETGNEPLEGLESKLKNIAKDGILIHPGATDAGDIPVIQFLNCSTEQLYVAPSAICTITVKSFKVRSLE